MDDRGVRDALLGRLEQIVTPVADIAHEQEVEGLDVLRAGQVGHRTRFAENVLVVHEDADVFAQQRLLELLPVPRDLAEPVERPPRGRHAAPPPSRCARLFVAQAFLRAVHHVRDKVIAEVRVEELEESGGIVAMAAGVDRASQVTEEPEPLEHAAPLIEILDPAGKVAANQTEPPQDLLAPHDLGAGVGHREKEVPVELVLAHEGLVDVEALLPRTVLFQRAPLDLLRQVGLREELDQRQHHVERVAVLGQRQELHRVVVDGELPRGEAVPVAPADDSPDEAGAFDLHRECAEHDEVQVDVRGVLGRAQKVGQILLAGGDEDPHPALGAEVLQERSDLAGDGREPPQFRTVARFESPLQLVDEECDLVHAMLARPQLRQQVEEEVREILLVVGPGDKPVVGALQSSLESGADLRLDLGVDLLPL